MLLSWQGYSAASVPGTKNWPLSGKKGAVHAPFARASQLRHFGLTTGRLIDNPNLGYAESMTISSRVPSRLAHLMIVPLLMTPLPVAAAEARNANVAKSVPSPVKATTDIIALPLNPTLPAGQRLCATKAASGLGYTMLRPATGAMPAEADVVLVNYIGYLAATGAVFDQGMQAAFPVNGVIPGFSKGLQMLAKGGVARFCIPAAMGYGAQGSGSIPANSDLVFQVELVDYKTAAEIEEMRKAGGAGPATPTDPVPSPQ